MISDFDELSELRGWLWEVFFMVKENEPKKAILKNVADKYGLFVVQD